MTYKQLLELLAEGKLTGGYHPEMEAIHKSNAKRLREIITSFGYPCLSKVGEKASSKHCSPKTAG